MMVATGIFFLIGYALGAGHIILLHYILKNK
jgi:hypothetical protein